MAGKIQKITVGEINGTAIEQRSVDGFINGTAMCVANGKEIAVWFRNKETLDLFTALAIDLDPEFKHDNSHGLDISRLSGSKYSKIFPRLIISKPGSPDTGGGTWLHPDLAIQLAQWCNSTFALLVSRWVREWMTSAYNPIQLEADVDRVQMRDELKDKKRLEFTGQIKAFLLAANKYVPGSKNTNLEFIKAHDKLNKLLTSSLSEIRFFG
jgi:KilA-N domain